MSISRIYRLLRLITLLQGGRTYTARELARELEVSRRTIFRDLNMLELAHIPYYYDPKRGGYKINRHFFLPPINLTLSEALAVLMLAGRLQGARCRCWPTAPRQLPSSKAPSRRRSASTSAV